jgi:hypothetical protein
MYRQAKTAAAVLWTALAFTAPAAADVLTEWNMCAQTIIGTGRATVQFGAGPSTQLDLAVVHLAMHDAIQAYDQHFEPFAGAIAAGGGSPIAAAARAARTVLLSKFPALQSDIDACYTRSLGGVVADMASILVGDTAANNVLHNREGDGSFPSSSAPAPPAGTTGPGQWRPNPPAVSMAAPWGGAVRPFAIESVERCQPEDPPLLTSLEYAEAYNEVKALGSATGSMRTPEQSRIARMYSGGIPGQYNRLTRDLADKYRGGNTTAALGERGRLYALVNTAMADSFICSWHSKKKFNFWRPIHAIREGDLDDNILTEKSATWTPYFLPATPNYPDYTSGAANVTAASMRIFALFFGSDHTTEPFNIHAAPASTGLQPQAGDSPIEYHRFSDVMKDVVDARIYLGIHFRFADTEARSQGRRVAQHTFRNILQPLDGKK